MVKLQVTTRWLAGFGVQIRMPGSVLESRGGSILASAEVGGEVIRELHYDPSLRKVAVDRLLRDVVYEDGGPLVHNGSEGEQRSFDSTCRKLHRFLTQPQP
jgi:hypothetical protein